MERLTIDVGGFDVNCTILAADGKAWIVDPGQEAERLVRLLTEKGLTPAAILLTHAHFDHIGAVPGLQKAFPDLPVFIHPNDDPVLTHPLNQLPPEYPPIARPKNLLTAVADVGLPGLELIETPGHTPGGACYYLPAERLLLSGDTLFAGSAGRTDLLGGDYATLMGSLRKLTALPDDTIVIAGHGPVTTIGTEKRTNPFLRG